MAFMKLTDNLCWFTSVNKDTAEVWHEFVGYDAEVAQQYSDRAYEIIMATGPLTSRNLLTSIGKFTEAENLFFYDAIAPTVFRSPLTAWMFEDTPEAEKVRSGFITRVPKGRLGEPEDLAGPLLFLSSKAWQITDEN